MRAATEQRTPWPTPRNSPERGAHFPSPRAAFLLPRRVKKIINGKWQIVNGKVSSFKERTLPFTIS